MSSAYLIYSSLIIQSSHMLFNTNLPITSASYGRTCRVMNTLFSLSWHLRWKKKKKVRATFIQSARVQHAIEARRRRDRRGSHSFTLPLIHLPFAFFLYLTFLLHLHRPGLCVNSRGERGNMAHSRSLSELWNGFQLSRWYGLTSPPPKANSPTSRIFRP